MKRALAQSPRLAIIGLTLATLDAGAQAIITDHHPLDGLPREVGPSGVICPEIELVHYEGTRVRYHTPLRVHPAFRERLRRFEEIVSDAAVAVYGRPPDRIRHLGSYHCRRIRAYPTLISEHAMGNALDVEGFDFGRTRASLARGVPERLKHSFKVRILDHWNGARGIEAFHSRFLRTLARRLIDEKGLFRVLLGPSWPGHKNHFHFDCAPYRVVSIFE